MLILGGTRTEVEEGGVKAVALEIINMNGMNAVMIDDDETHIRDIDRLVYFK